MDDNFKDVQSTAVKIMDECVARIRANMTKHYRTSRGERWINASGRSSQAFMVEVLDDSVRLVYRGADVAPLDSIENGSEDLPTVENIERWRAEKMASGAGELPPADVIVERIKMNATERAREPQTWVVRPEVLAAAEELRTTISGVFVSEATATLFKNR